MLSEATDFARARSVTDATTAEKARALLTATIDSQQPMLAAKKQDGQGQRCGADGRYSRDGGRRH
jgi:hypothetical protein